MSAAVVVEDWRPLIKNSLRGFVRVRLPSGIVVHDVAVHVREDRKWVSPPGRPAIGRDGTQMRDSSCKPLFNPTITFADKTTADKFSVSILTALQAAHPEALS